MFGDDGGSGAVDAIISEEYRCEIREEKWREGGGWRERRGLYMCVASVHYDSARWILGGNAGVEQHTSVEYE